MENTWLMRLGYCAWLAIDTDSNASLCFNLKHRNLYDLKSIAEVKT